MGWIRLCLAGFVLRTVAGCGDPRAGNQILQTAAHLVAILHLTVSQPWVTLHRRLPRWAMPLGARGDPARPSGPAASPLEHLRLVEGQGVSSGRVARAGAVPVCVEFTQQQPGARDTRRQSAVPLPLR